MPKVLEVMERFEVYLQENGGKLEESLAGAVDMFGRMTTFLLENENLIKGVGVVVVTLTAAFAALSAILTVLGVVAAVALSPILGTVAAVAAVAAGVAAAFVAWGPPLEDVSTWFDDLIDQAKELLRWVGLLGEDTAKVALPEPGAGDSPRPDSQAARAAAERENKELDKMLGELLSFHRKEQAKQPPDPWTQRHTEKNAERQARIQEKITELARKAGDAEYRRSQDAGKAAQVAVKPSPHSKRRRTAERS
ncbi:MAG: hypothetical protein HC814_02145, partial [Rhodobacteraceae bacterium]|nr:hypothetical protein [Paracoccaceae bacterium]